MRSGALLPDQIHWEAMGSHWIHLPFAVSLRCEMDFVPPGRNHVNRSSGRPGDQFKDSAHTTRVLLSSGKVPSLH